VAFDSSLITTLSPDSILLDGVEVGYIAEDGVVITIRGQAYPIPGGNTIIDVGRIMDRFDMFASWSARQKDLATIGKAWNPATTPLSSSAPVDSSYYISTRTLSIICSDVEGGALTISGSVWLQPGAGWQNSIHVPATFPMRAEFRGDVGDSRKMATITYSAP